MTNRYELPRLERLALMGIAASFALVVTSALPARAAMIAWQEPVAISSVGDSIVNTSGTLVKAINFTPTAAIGTKTVNGVPFVVQTTVEAGWDSLDGNNGYYTDGNVGSDFSDILVRLMRGTIATAPTDETLILTGLNPGQFYLAQFFVSDDRTANNVGSRTQYFSDGVNDSTTVANNFSYSLIGTFTADATTQNVIVTGLQGGVTVNNNGQPLLNAYQVRAIPEPQSICLCLVGLGLLGFVAAKRRTARLR